MRLLSSIILTRLLSPEDFGLVAIGMTILVGISMFCDLGLRQVIVTSRRGEEVDFRNTLWVTQIIQGVAMFAIAAGAALAIALAVNGFDFRSSSVYGDSRFPWILLALSSTVVILGFEPTKAGLAVRNMQTGRAAIVDVTTQLVSACATVGLAYMLRSVWPLAIGAIVGAFARLAIGTIVYEGRWDRLGFDKEYFREIFQTSRWVLASSAMGFAVNHTDKLIFSVVLTARELGTVTIALSLLGVLFEISNRLVGSVVFPKLSAIVAGGDPNQLRYWFERFRWLLDSAVFFVIGFLWFGSAVIVGLLFDVRYAEAGDYLRVLAITLIWSIANCGSNLAMAMGKPNLLASTTLFRLICLMIFPWAGYLISGVTGLTWALALAVVPPTIYSQLQVRRLLGLEGLQLRSVLPLLFLPIGLMLGLVVSRLFVI